MSNQDDQNRRQRLTIVQILLITITSMVGGIITWFGLYITVFSIIAIHEGRYEYVVWGALAKGLAAMLLGLALVGLPTYFLKRRGK